MSREITKILGIGFCLLLHACLLAGPGAAPPGNVSAERVRERIGQAAARGWLSGCSSFLTDISRAFSPEDCLREGDDTLTTFITVPIATVAGLNLEHVYYRNESVAACEDLVFLAVLLSTREYFLSKVKTVLVGNVRVRRVGKTDLSFSGFSAATVATAQCETVLEPAGNPAGAEPVFY